MKNVRDFGARGDGLTKDTAAIQKAIDAGGMVCFPAGTYLSGTLYLRSHGGLELAPGAVLLASPDPADYNANDFCSQNRVFASELVSGAHFIVAVEQENIVIRGGGCIDGHHSAWLNTPDPRNPVWYLRTWRPAQMIFLCECKDIRIEDVELANAPYWTCFLHGCVNATLRGLHIHGDTMVPNNDGIDIDSCQQVTVSDCIINSADDGIALRGSWDALKTRRPCEHVTIANCIIASGYANGIRVGVGNGIVRHCCLSNLVVHHTRTAVCVVSKYNPKTGEGTQISDIAFSNLQLDVLRPFNIKLDNAAGFENPCRKSISRLRFGAVYGRAELSNYIHGNGVGTVEDISFADLALTYGGNGPRPDRDAQGHWGRGSTHAAFDLLHARHIDFDHVGIAWESDEPGWKYDIEAVHCEPVTTTSCRFSKGIRND